MFIYEPILIDEIIKRAADPMRFVTESESEYESKLDGIVITEVPDDIMQTAFDFSVGWTAAESAKQINMLLFDPLAIAAPVVYDVAMISAPTAQSKGKYLYYERYYYDVFPFNERAGGVYANVSA